MKYKSKKVTKKSLIWVAVALALSGGAAKYFWPVDSAQAKSVVQTVTTFVVEQRDFPLVLDATGSTVAANIVDIRPQVTNVVAKVHIKEGQMVKAGDMLISLDDRADRANYDKVQATADDAQRQLNRAEELLRQQFVAQGAVDTARANAQAAQAAARAAQAALSYDNIRSPITGRAGIINVFPGALVQPGNTVSTTTTATTTTTQGAMVTITQLDPINVQFTISEKEIPLILGKREEGDDLTVSVEVNGTDKPIEGKVYVVDNQVDPAIGAVRVKAELNNKDGAMIPGQFVRIKLKAKTLKDALIIPTQAVVTNPKGDFLYVVEKDNKVTLKPIKIVYQYQGQSAVTGVAAEDKIVVEGKQNLRPNGQIRETKSAEKAKPQ